LAQGLIKYGSRIAFQTRKLKTSKRERQHFSKKRKRKDKLKIPTQERILRGRKTKGKEQE
jgi:hypothetical protein